MRAVSWQTLAKIVGIVGIVSAPLLSPIVPPVVADSTDQICRKDSPDPDPANRINSAPCGMYGEAVSRVADTGEDIVIRFMVHKPQSKSKAVVVLIAGGILATGITGNPATGQVLTAGQNFLVRSAQIFADDAYTALTIHRPLRLTAGGPVAEFPTEGPDSLQWDHYRISAKHAFDIVRALALVNTDNLPIFLVGTSRASISVVANNMLGNGILLSSPVANLSGVVPPGWPGCPPAMTCALFVGHPWPALQPDFVTVPTFVLVHPQDACPGTAPATSLALHNAFLAAGIDSQFETVDGGFAAPEEPACEALHFHGFFGVETKAVKAQTKRLDEMLANLDKQFKGNAKPIASPGAVGVATAYTIDLATLVSDPGDALAYNLPYQRSYRASPSAAPNLSLVGSAVTYTPVGPGPLTDGFTYVASDGKGGISASYVVVTVPP